MGSLFTACHGVEEWDNDARGNFDCLWTLIDEHYCFLTEKGLDWDSVYTVYSPRVSTAMTSEELFRICSEMLDELRDGHVNLSSPYATSYYRQWWSDYPQNYDGRIIQQYYFNFNYSSLGAFDYGYLTDNVGYIYYSSFSSSIGEGNLDYILSYLGTAQALIIDVRDNGGGEMTNVEKLVRRFVRTRTLVGYISHKTGPGHNDFSEPYAYYYAPIGDGHISWAKPVIILTNRSTFSAANNFVSVMRLLDGVTLVGDVTGGGSGMPLSLELPNGWGLRMSACSVLDAQGHTTEFGVEPDYYVDMDAEEALSGRDSILDFALKLISNQTNDAAN